MNPRKSKPIDYQSLESSELVWLAQLSQDRQAELELLGRKQPVIDRLARNCVRKYPFVDLDDMRQSLTIAFFKVILAYRPGKQNGWDKYCYFRLTGCVKDILRQRDDLGIGWPQKKKYPQWFHIYHVKDSEDNLFADTISDHRGISEEQAEQLAFVESLHQLRDALAVARCQPTVRAAAPSTHDRHPDAWSQFLPNGRSQYFYVHDDQQSPRSSKRKRVTPTLIQWRQQRSKPKQLVMW